MPKAKKRGAEPYDPLKEVPAKVPSILWKRAAAFLIDIVIVYFIFFLAVGDQLSDTIPKAASFAQSYAVLVESDNLISSLSVIYSLLLFIYFLLLERRFGQSIGKMVMKLKVVGEDPITFWRHIGRVMFLIPFFPFILLWLIEPIVMLFTENNRRLGEIVSRTQVVEYQEVQPLPSEK